MASCEKMSDAVRPCLDWQRGECARGAACPDFHEPSYAGILHRRRRPLAPVATLALPDRLRAHHVFRHSMAEEMAGIVREATGVDDLATLHLTPEGRMAVEGRTAAGPTGRNSKFIKRWSQALRPGSLRSRIDDCIRRFVALHVSAALDATAHGFTEVLYQVEPSLRCHLPHARPSIPLHKDAYYWHQPNELNIWVPLVPGVRGSNSLFCESTPGAADYAPFGTAGHFDWAARRM